VITNSNEVVLHPSDWIQNT